MSALGKQLKARRRKAAEVQMAPMIDMVFLLLVFFMCVSSISQAGLNVKVDLPESASSETPEDLSGRITISVTMDSYYLGGKALGEDELVPALGDLSEEAAGTKLLLRADRGVPFSRMRRLLQAAADAGISDYIFATHQL